MDGDINKLPTNFWVNNFLTLLDTQHSTSSRKPLTCEHCESGDPAVSRCTTCCVFMCEFCVTAHKRISATKDHKILSMEEVKQHGSKALRKSAFCSKHSEETLKLFCLLCQKTICRDCTIVDHRGHDFKFVAEIVREEKTVIQRVLQKTKATELAVADGLKAVQLMKNRVGVQAAKVNEEVDSFFQKQVKELEIMCKNLKQQVSKQQHEKLSQLEGQSKVLSSFLEQLKSGINFTEQAIADGDDMELLSVKKQVIQRLSQLNASQYECQPCQDDYLELRVCKTVKDIGKMAVLQHIPIDPAKCVVSMVGGEEGVLYETFVGQTVDFLLTLNRIGGGTVTTDCCNVSAIIKYRDHQRETQEKRLAVYANGDGLYSFSFHPEDVGPVMLTVKVGGINAGGSPFMWDVKTKEQDVTFKGAKKMKMTSAAVQGATVAKEGMQCWKLKLVSYSGTSELEIGVQASVVQTIGGSVFGRSKPGKWSWQCHPFRQEDKFVRSDGQMASITSVEDDDVFSVFLNLAAKKLIIYNTRSKQSETFTGVEGELVPLYTPSLRYNTGIVFGKTSYLTLDF